MKNENAITLTTFSMSEESNGFLLWKVSNLWQRELKAQLDPFDLTHTQFALLASVGWNSLSKDQVTQVDLSEHTKVDPMTTSTVVRTLEMKGLLTRAPHKTDTRAKVITLTAEGKSTLESAIERVENFENEFFESFKDSDELKNSLQLLLRYSR